MKSIQSPMNKVYSDVVNTGEQIESDKLLAEVAHNQHTTERVDGKTLLKPEQNELQVLHHMKAEDVKTQTTTGACNDCPIENGSVKAKISTFEERINEKMPETKKDVSRIHLVPKIRVISDGILTDIIPGRGFKSQKPVTLSISKRQMDTGEDYDELEDKIEVFEEGVRSNKKEKKSSRFRKWMRRFREACSDLSERMFYCCNNITVV